VLTVRLDLAVVRAGGGGSLEGQHPGKKTNQRLHGEREGELCTLVEKGWAEAKSERQKLKMTKGVWEAAASIGTSQPARDPTGRWGVGVPKGSMGI